MGTVTCEDPRMEDLRKRLSESLKVKTSNGEDIRLTYFPARGRAEISRLILAYAAVKYDDIRLTGEEFGKVKPILPYGSVPILEHKGEVLCESMAIAKYLAEECGLAGTCNLTKAQADEIVLGINGIFESVAKCICLRGGQYFAGNALTYADLMVVVLQDNLRSAVIV